MVDAAFGRSENLNLAQALGTVFLHARKGGLAGTLPQSSGQRALFPLFAVPLSTGPTAPITQGLTVSTSCSGWLAMALAVTRLWQPAGEICGTEPLAPCRSRPSPWQAAEPEPPSAWQPIGWGNRRATRPGPVTRAPQRTDLYGRRSRRAFNHNTGLPLGHRWA
jgi:hypothetical protein